MYVTRRISPSQDKNAVLESLIPATVPGFDHDAGGIPPTDIGTVFLYERFAGLYDISVTDVPVQAETDLPSTPVTCEYQVGDISLRVDYTKSPTHATISNQAISGFLARVRMYWAVASRPAHARTGHSDDDAFPEFTE